MGLFSCFVIQYFGIEFILQFYQIISNLVCCISILFNCIMDYVCFDDRDPAYENRRVPQTLTSLMLGHRNREAPTQPTRGNPAYAFDSRTSTCQRNPSSITGNLISLPAFPTWSTSRLQRSQSLHIHKENIPTVRPFPNPAPQVLNSVMSVNSLASSSNAFQTANFSASTYQIRTAIQPRNVSQNNFPILSQRNNPAPLKQQNSLREETLTNLVSSRMDSLEILSILSAKSVYPYAPSIPFFQTKKYLISPTKLVDRIYEDSTQLSLKKWFIFKGDHKKDLLQTSDTFSIQVRLTQVNKMTKKMEKCSIKSIIHINNFSLGLEDSNIIPQLNPTFNIPLEVIEDSNVINGEWFYRALPENSELHFSVEILQKLTDDEMLALVLQRAPISRATTIDKIKGVIDRSVGDGMMENGAYMEVSLICPLGKCKMSSPCRASTCTHYSCFDVETFLQMSKVHPTWKCPICNDQIDYDEIRIDRFFEDIVRSCGKDTLQIQINSQGEWIPIESPENYDNGPKNSSEMEMNCSPHDESEDLISPLLNLKTEPMDFAVKRTSKPRQSIEIIFEKPPKRFKPN